MGLNTGSIGLFLLFPPVRNGDDDIHILHHQTGLLLGLNNYGLEGF